LERVTDEKLTHMLSLWYVTSIFNIPSTSKTVFVKPIVFEPPPACVDKGKAVIGGEGSVDEESLNSLIPKEALPYATTVV
jgi:hypothetical protein